MIIGIIMLVVPLLALIVAWFVAITRQEGILKALMGLGLVLLFLLYLGISLWFTGAL